MGNINSICWCWHAHWWNDTTKEEKERSSAGLLDSARGIILKEAVTVRFMSSWVNAHVIQFCRTGQNNPKGHIWCQTHKHLSLLPFIQSDIYTKWRSTCGQMQPLQRPLELIGCIALYYFACWCLIYICAYVVMPSFPAFCCSACLPFIYISLIYLLHQCLPLRQMDVSTNSKRHIINILVPGRSRPRSTDRHQRLTFLPMERCWQKPGWSIVQRVTISDSNPFVL